MSITTGQSREEQEYIPIFEEYDEFMRHVFKENYEGFRTILEKRPEIIDCINIGALDLHYIDIQNSFGNKALQEFDVAVRQRLASLEATLCKTREYCSQKQAS